MPVNFQENLIVNMNKNFELHNTKSGATMDCNDEPIRSPRDLHEKRTESSNFSGASSIQRSVT